MLCFLRKQQTILASSVRIVQAFLLIILSILLDLKEGFVLSVIGFLWISGLQKGHVLPDNSPLLSLIVTSTLYYILLILIAIFFKFEGVSNIKLLFKKNERN